MRIWDIKTKYLCKNHLLGEHRELHAIWNIITKNKISYKNHPEVKRWRGKLKALYLRHEEEIKEMKKRGYRHKSNLNKNQAKGEEEQKLYLESISEQIKNIKDKKCSCFEK